MKRIKELEKEVKELEKEVKKLRRENTNLKEAITIAYNRLLAISHMGEDQQIHIEIENWNTYYWEEYTISSNEFIANYYNSGGVWDYMDKDEAIADTIREITERVNDIENWKIYINE